MIGSRVWIVVVVACTGAVAAGCGGSSSVKLVPTSSNQQQNVMVIDEGIDLSASDLQGKVTAAYTETCPDDSGGSTSDAASPPAVDGGPVFDMLKQEFLAELAQPDDSCDLKPGISAKPDPLASVARYKARWNAMVKAGQTPAAVFTPAEITALMNPIDTEFSAFNYHGTATSTTVAHENPDVRLVLVERQLGSEESLMTNFPCIQQADIDQLVDLLDDPEVYAAFVKQPAQIDALLTAAESKGDVGLVNESFGSASRQTLEMLQAANCMTPVTLSAYYQILDQATNDHDATIVGPPVLTVQAAGNDGVEIDSGADSLSCDLGDPKSLLVGAYNPGTSIQNMFSDFGKCVNVFAPGQSIVVEYAGGWLTWASGTSFASPLTVRYTSMAAGVPAPFDPTTARAAVLAAADPTSTFLPVSLFPSDFFYLPGTTTPEFAVPVAVPRPASKLLPRLTQYELHRVLGPLNRLRRLKGTL